MADVINELIVRCVRAARRHGAVDHPRHGERAQDRRPRRHALRRPDRLGGPGRARSTTAATPTSTSSSTAAPRADPDRRRRDRGLMAKPQRAFVCQSCGAAHPRWAGRCDDCGAWNSLVEEAAASPAPAAGGKAPRPAARARAAAGATPRRRRACPAASTSSTACWAAASSPGPAILIGGDPGIGKSTLMLQAAAALARAGPRGRLCQRRGIDRPDPPARRSAGPRRRAGAAGQRHLGRRHPGHGRPTRGRRTW